MTCDLCGGATARFACDWTFRCAHCGLWQSTLVPAIDEQEHGVSEDDRLKGLQHTRFANFNFIFERLSRLTALDSVRILDVGCAFGWFVAAAVSRGMTVMGIEPDARTAQVPRSRGFDVIQGYFPQCLPPSQTFDVIVFNDVLEHIPQVHAVLAASAAAIQPRGHLVLSVPTSSGTLFRLARMMARLGWKEPWGRLWQEGLPSPHVYYFNRTNLDTALRAHGFSLADVRSMPAFHPKGLWSRMKFNRRGSVVMNVLLYLGLLAGYPAYRALGRPDTELLIYQNRGRPDRMTPGPRR